MADKFDPIPERTAMVNRGGLITRVWYQFLYKLFGDFEKRLRALEATSEDHESRITALEP